MLAQRIMWESAEDRFPEHHEPDPKARRTGSWNATPVAFVRSLGPAMKSLTIIRICRLLQKSNKDIPFTHKTNLFIWQPLPLVFSTGLRMSRSQSEPAGIFHQKKSLTYNLQSFILDMHISFRISLYLRI